MGWLPVVENVDLDVARGEVLGIVGESGSGKSVTAYAIAGLLPPQARVSADHLSFGHLDLLRLKPRERRSIMGRQITMIFQEPVTRLNPCFTVGFQICEMLKAHESGTAAQRRDKAVALLADVGIPDPGSRMSAYPHQLSGGMSQRVMIAMAIACRPQLIIADEPTTALDVTVQAQILELLRRLQRENGMSLILITHDLAVLAESAVRVLVMYAGQAVESRPVQGLLEVPHHPYTAALLRSLPDASRSAARLPTIPGTVPGAKDRPRHCVFQPRCGLARPCCKEDRPPYASHGDGWVRCHFPLAAQASFIVP
jgi:dipeptide transport system ATP-binding protein